MSEYTVMINRHCNYVFQREIREWIEAPAAAHWVKQRFDIVKEALAQLGVGNVQLVPVEKRDQFITDIDAALAAKVASNG